MQKNKLGLLAAISVVIANMIGTGVFTSLGFQLLDITDFRAILLLWIIGGVLALFGSFCYAELSSSFPKSGGEYHFLSISMGKTVGFLSGWTSAVLGFAAPIAAAAHAFAEYFSHILPITLDPMILSVGIILIISLIHSVSLQTGARFQVVFTLGKIILLIVFIGYGLFLSAQPGAAAGSSYLKTADLSQQIGQAGFWVGLIFVSYAYSGWNASAYMIDEIQNPVRNVPRSIIFGAVVVMILYTLLNFTFLLAAPANEMVGRPDVAFVAAEYLFNVNGAAAVSALIAFFLISTISSMIMVGPRVIHRIAEDNPELKFFSQRSYRSIPLRAIWLQTGIALVLLVTSPFEFIVTAIGFILAFFTTLTAASTIILRYKFPKQDRPVKIPLYPLPPLIYIAFNIWTMIYVGKEKPTEMLFGIGFLLIGLLFFRFALHKKIFRPLAGMLLLAVVLVGCEQKSNSSTQAPTSTSDSLVAPAETFVLNTVLDARASKLAGLDTAELSDDNQKILQQLNLDWSKHDTSILEKIRSWSRQEQYASFGEKDQFVFYPFSGPDIPFVQAFYPDAPLYVLVGLERAASPKSLILQENPDYNVFLQNAQQYFYFSSRYGFFRTLDMEKQFMERGVLDILSYYLKKLNCRLGDVYVGRWSQEKNDTVHQLSDESDFCHIRFQRPDGKMGDLLYFSKDLSDNHLSKDSTWLQWITKIQGNRKMVSLTKSASYLMGRPYFDIVRSFILKESDLHIQDDSGIRYDYLQNSGRKIQLYGKYTRTIPVFADRFRPEMAKAYESDSVPRLPFMIGYTAVYGECNLQVIK